MIKVSSVKVYPDYILLVSFSTGENKYFDMKPYLHYPVFLKLTNPDFFALASVAYDTVIWPGDIDIAPETLYAQGIVIDINEANF